MNEYQEKNADFFMKNLFFSKNVIYYHDLLYHTTTII